MTDRVRALLDFIVSGGTVCPFARSAPLTVLDLEDPDSIMARLTEFATGRKNALVVPCTDAAEQMLFGRPWTMTRSWAREMFLDLVGVLLWFHNPDTTEAERFVHIERVHAILYDDTSELRPVLALGRSLRPEVPQRPLMTICMSPLYPRKHPRFAPATCLVITWMDDVAAGLDTLASILIREKMAIEHGSVYDANDLVLPPPAPAGEGVTT